MTNVLITGANRGLGLGFVKSFLAKNVNVICTTRNIPGSKELLECKKKYPKNLQILELDLLGENSENALSDLLSDKPIDIFINNAGVGNSNQRFGVVSSKPWVEVLKVNLIAPITVTQSIIENIKKSSDKKIVGAIVAKMDWHRSPLGDMMSGIRGYIAMLAVDRNYRKKGIAKRLVKTLLKEMQLQGIVLLITSLMND